jgi:hypothetical protein
MPRNAERVPQVILPTQGGGFLARGEVRADASKSLGDRIASRLEDLRDRSRAAIAGTILVEGDAYGHRTEPLVVEHMIGRPFAITQDPGVALTVVKGREVQTRINPTLEEWLLSLTTQTDRKGRATQTFDE